MRNAQDFNQMASDKRWVNMMGAIKGISRDLGSLAPHPNRPDHKGPLFVKDETRAANRDDGATLANMLIGAIVGGHFMDVSGGGLSIPETSASLSAGNVIDAYDTFQHDRHSARSASGESNRGIELGQSAVICGGFNMTARRTSDQPGEAMAWEAYLRDLPNRRIMEQSLSSMNRQADQMEKNFMRLQRTMSCGM